MKAMPELPEVESLRRILSRSAKGRTIVSARVSGKSLRRPLQPDFCTRILGRTIQRIGRRAKYLTIELDRDEVALVHLGMSGSLTHRSGAFSSNALDPRHDHVDLALDDGTHLVYNDPRRFGLIKIVSRQELDAIGELKGLGPEPLGPKFDCAYLASKARGRTAAVKNLLMDQRVVAGIGNIYACEILFRAGIRPERPAGRLKAEEVERIVAATRAVLGEAIGRRGTTFRSYMGARGQPGRFAERLQVYGRQREPCRKCGTLVRKATVGGRASFYCPRCQK